MTTTLQKAQDLFDQTQAWRRDFHRHPEIGLEEFRTAGIVAKELVELGIETTTGVGKTGVVGLIEGGLPGPVVLLRFDMDALRVQEETGAEYASQTPGLMHACGHDGHVAVGLTVARMLNAERERIHGKIKLVFQPAEEGMGGAELMVKDGVLTNPKPDYSLALHMWNEKPVGWVGVKPGPTMAGADMFSVKLTGKGGHGALPHQTIDPVWVGAQIVSALQAVVSRNLSPLESGVVSVTMFHAGDAMNVIPPVATLGGTIRSFTSDVRKKILDRFKKVVESVAAAGDCSVEIHFQDITPPVINHPAVANVVAEAVRRVDPALHVEANCQTMASEDMAYLMQHAPGCYYFIGSANGETGLSYPHHHPKFDIDERALTIAAAVMTEAALLAGEKFTNN